MTGVALEMGLLVLELIMWPGWGAGVGKGWAFLDINPTDRSHPAGDDLLG